MFLNPVCYHPRHEARDTTMFAVCGDRPCHYSLSTLLIRNLQDVFGETTRFADARLSTRYSPKIACSTIPMGACIVAATRSIESRAGSRPLMPTFDIRLPSPRKWAMAGGQMGRGLPWRGTSLRRD